MQPRTLSRRSIIAITVIAIVIIAAIAACLWLRSESASRAERFSLTERGIIAWYEVRGGHASLAAHPSGYDSASDDVIAAAPPLASGAVPVLSALGAAGASLGLMQNGTLTPLLAPAFRYYLSDDGKGTVYYIEATSTGTSRLYSYAVGEGSSALADLGPASAASAAPDGSIVAATMSGIVRIKPGASSAPSVLVPVPASGIMYYPAIASDAGAVAYWDQGKNAIELYSLAAGNGPAFVASIPLSAARPDAVGFAPSGDLVVKTGSTLTFYSVRSGAAGKEVTITAE